MPLSKPKDYRFFISVFLIIALIPVSYFTFIKGPKYRNIILISIDCLRADHLSCYGYKRLTTPNIDKLAEKGIIFLQAIAPGTDTFHSIPVIMTSTYSHYFRVEESLDVLINPSVPTLAEILRDNGYSTAFFSDDGPFPMIKGVKRGFETFVVTKTSLADKLTSDIVKWLEFNKKKRFFLWIHFYGPHAPYWPPKPFNTLYISDSLTAEDKQLPVDSGDDMFTLRNIIPHIVIENSISSVNYYISQYDGEIRFVDEQIGLILNKLEALKLQKNTGIIITADHGESLGEHGVYFQHGGGMPFDSILHIPLIIKGNLQTPGNIKIRNQVSSADIFPTILDMLKIKCPVHVRGENLFNLVLGKRKDHSAYTFSAFHDKWYSLRTEKWKLISLDNSRRNYLFDLENDKDELINIRDGRKEEFNILSKELNEWIEENRSRGYSEGRSFLDKEALEKLQSLGYLQGGKGMVDKKKSFSFSELMDTYSGPTVTVSGKVIFDSYEDGPISIFVKTEDRTGPPDVAIITIPKPGGYILKVPKDFGNINIGAVNIRSGRDPEPGDPMEEYVNNPIKIGAADISNINIIIK